METIRAGPSPNPEDNLVRGVFTDAHAEKMASLVADAVDKGAKVVVGPESSHRYEGGNVVQPVVLDRIAPNMSELQIEVRFQGMGLTVSSQTCTQRRYSGQ